MVSDTRGTTRPLNPQTPAISRIRAKCPLSACGGQTRNVRVPDEEPLSQRMCGARRPGRSQFGCVPKPFHQCRASRVRNETICRHREDVPKANVFGTLSRYTARPSVGLLALNDTTTIAVRSTLVEAQFKLADDGSRGLRRLSRMPVAGQSTIRRFERSRIAADASRGCSPAGFVCQYCRVTRRRPCDPFSKGDARRARAS